MKHIDLLNHLLILKYYGFRFKIEMSGAELEGSDLRMADLRRADFRRVNLEGSDLEEADLRRAYLEGSDLRMADLRRADLRMADLRGADLRRADLRGADLRRADLRRANLEGSNIDFSCWPLHCGSADVKIDEQTAKQLLSHAFSVAIDFWPDGITETQKQWLNEFHRIKNNNFPKFE